MRNLIRGIQRFFLEEEGASAVEYGILVALIAVAVVATVYLVGQELNNVFAKVKNCLQSATAGGSTC